MESCYSYAKAQLSHRICLGDRQQFNHRHRRHHRKAPSDQEDDLGWGDFPISSRLTGIYLVPCCDLELRTNLLLLFFFFE